MGQENSGYVYIRRADGAEGYVCNSLSTYSANALCYSAGFP